MSIGEKISFWKRSPEKRIERLVARNNTAGLTKALKDKDESMRWMAALALGNTGNSKVIPALTKALKDDSWKVRKFTAEALGNIDDQGAVVALVALPARFQSFLQDDRERLAQVRFGFFFPAQSYVLVRHGVMRFRIVRCRV